MTKGAVVSHKKEDCEVDQQARETHSFANIHRWFLWIGHCCTLRVKSSVVANFAYIL